MTFSDHYSNDTGEKTWHHFVTGKEMSLDALPAMIRDSWRRSVKAGVDPLMDQIPLRLMGDELLAELERKRDFLEIALPVVEDLYVFVKGTNSGVWITNEQGTILYGIADPEDLPTCERQGLAIGADFSESTCGTNAIGTSIVLKQPVMIAAHEHYARVCRQADCCATPILNSAGEIIGVVNMAGYRNSAHPHTLGMVVAAASAIRREMHRQSLHKRVKVAHDYVLAMMESLPSGVLVVNPEGAITAMNCKACEMLKSTHEQLLNQNIFEKFGPLTGLQKTLKHGLVMEDTEQYFTRGNQRLHIVVSCRPIIGKDGVMDGAVAVLREIDAVVRITNQLAGHTAKFTFDNIVGQDGELRKVMANAKSSAASNANVLLLGESGTGKEMFSQAIHNASSRRNGPFIAVNCGAIPRELLGSELFGYEEGAFTGAKRDGSPGKFELANNGTLFLDEIGDMPLHQQLALLRVLQDKKVTRLGGNREIPVNVRLITATNHNLRRMVAEKLFRQDLFYRLNVITLHLPPLRHRSGDIELLTQFFLKQQCEIMGRPIPDLTPAACSLLANYHWPGNIRELENTLERAVVLTPGPVLDVDAFALYTNEPFPQGNHEIYQLVDLESSQNDSNKPLKFQEKVMIEHVLDECQWNITQSAARLGITRATLYRKIRLYSIQ